jgi:N-acetylmuramoyl-L-alanine amidase
MMLVHRAGEALLATGLSILLLTTWTAAADAAAPGKRSAAASCDRAQFRVVVDVGHTAQSPGAASARGVDEFDFNLRLAKEINRKLLDMGFTRTVLLVTKGATRKGLMERVARANEAKPDVFLSIHHDSVPDQLKEKWEFEGTKRGYNDKYPGHSIFISGDNPEYQASLLFATIIGKELKARGMRYTPHYTYPIMGSRQRILVDTDAGVYRYDQLIVLRQTRMPAVLLEAGSIVNRSEELILAGAERQKLVAAAVGESIDRYCQLHPPRTSAPVAKQERQEGGPQVIPTAATIEHRSRAATSQ